MTLRTKSRLDQRCAWGILLLADIASYIISVRLFGDGTSAWRLFSQANVVFFVPITFVFGWLGYEMRWDGVERDEDDIDGEYAAWLAHANETVAAAEALLPKKGYDTEDHPEGSGERNAAPRELMPGEAEWMAAQALPHQEIPDHTNDGEFLLLLSESVNLGFTPAMVQLGEFAMRREAWIEAYYWMRRARRQGMQNLASILLDIRLQWAMSGNPNEEDNVHPLFSPEDGSIARALINMDTGRDSSRAREFLQEQHPEWL